MRIPVHHPRLLLASVLLLLSAGVATAVIARRPEDSEGGVVNILPGADPTPTLPADIEDRLRTALDNSGAIAELIGERNYTVDFVGRQPIEGRAQAYNFVLAWDEPLTVSASWRLLKCQGTRIHEFTEALTITDALEVQGVVDLKTSEIIALGVTAPIPRPGIDEDSQLKPKLLEDADQRRIIVRDVATMDVVAVGKLTELPPAFRACPPGLDDD